MRYSVFISYASEDRDTAKKLYSDLETEGYSVFLDVHCIAPGQRWDEVIMESLENTPCIIVLLSERSVTKEGYISEEISRALDMEGAKDCNIIPVCLDNCPAPSDRRLADIQNVCIYPSYDMGLRKILSALATLHLPEKQKDRNEILIKTLLIIALIASMWGLVRCFL